jgi:isopenicillin-N N-acyltransferase like protein
MPSTSPAVGVHRCPHSRWTLLVVAAVLAPANSARCNGQATPGPRNTLPIDEAPPVFVKSVPNGKLFTVGQGDDKKDLLHLYGTPYENGFAMGTLLGPKFPSFVAEVYRYVEAQVISNLGNATWCTAHILECAGLREVMKLGLSAALELSYRRTAAYIKPYAMDEIRGLADATQGKVSLADTRNIMWIGELTRGSCSMFGAKDSATAHSRGGKLLQLRALDWDVDGPFVNFAAIIVYHPQPGGGNAWANLGFAGWTASITGISEKQLAVGAV